MAEAESIVVGGRYYDPLPAGERDTPRSGEGEGLTRRGKTPEHLLARAKQMRREPTPQEEKLWAKLRAGRLDGWKFRHQSPIGRYVPDFCCPKAKLIVELDGSQHGEQEDYDEQRTAFLQRQGYRVLRFWNNDVDGNLEGVLQLISEALSNPLPAASRLSLSPGGRGTKDSPLPSGERAGERSEPGEGK